MKSLCSVSSGAVWTHKLLLLFCSVGCFWGPGYSKCSNHIWIVLSESWYGGTGCTAVPQLGVKLRVSGALRRREKGARAVHSLPVQGRHSVTGGQSRAATSQPSVMELCSKEICVCLSLIFLFSCRLYVCEDGCKSWHHLVVSVAVLQPELTSFPPPWQSGCSWSSATGEAQDFSRKPKCPKLFDNNYLKCSVKALNLPSQWLSSGPCNKKCIFLRTYSLGADY